MYYCYAKLMRFTEYGRIYITELQAGSIVRAWKISAAGDATVPKQSFGMAAEPCSIRSRVNRMWEAGAGDGQAP